MDANQRREEYFKICLASLLTGVNGTEPKLLTDAIEAALWTTDRAISAFDQTSPLKAPPSPPYIPRSY